MTQCKSVIRWLLLLGLGVLVVGCTVITVVDTAVSAAIKTVETAVDWVIPD